MKKVLIIDDASGVRHGTAEILEFEGFEVLEADNGRVGVEMARKHYPDVVICDIMMSELDGFGVLKELRSNPDTSSMPFIFLSAKSTKADIDKGLQAGADAYLTKPFTVEELIEAVNARLRRRAFDTLLELPYEKLPSEGKALLREVNASPLFATLEVDQRSRVLHYVYVEELEAGQTIRRDETARHCTVFSVLSGELEVIETDSAGNERSVAKLYRGNYFGERALFDDAPCGYARTRTKCRLLGITRANFDLLTKDDPAIAVKFMTVIIKGLLKKLDRAG